MATQMPALKELYRLKLLECGHTGDTTIQQVARIFRATHIMPFCDAFNVEYINDENGFRFQHYIPLTLCSSQAVAELETTVNGRLRISTPAYGPTMRVLLSTLELRVDPHDNKRLGNLVGGYDPLSKEPALDAYKHIRTLNDMITDLQVMVDASRVMAGSVIDALRASAEQPIRL